MSFFLDNAGFFLSFCRFVSASKPDFRILVPYDMAILQPLFFIKEDAYKPCKTVSDTVFYNPCYLAEYQAFYKRLPFTL